MVKDNDINRRSVLKGIGAAAMSVSVVGTATAAEAETIESAEPDAFREFARDVTVDVDPTTQAELVGRYDDVASARAEFEAAEPVLKELSARGYLESASLAEFALDEVAEDRMLEPTDAAASAGVTAVEHPDGATAHLMATTRSADHRVALYRLPELDRTHAFVETDDGSLVVHDAGDDGVSTTGGDCAWEAINCTNSICQTGSPPTCTEEQAYCCYGPNYERSCSDTRWACDCTC